MRRHMCFSKSSGLEYAIFYFFFRSGRTVFPMGKVDAVFKDLSNAIAQAI